MVEIWITDEDVASMPEVNAAVHEAAWKFALKWRYAMSPHTNTGRFVASIKVERANDKDYWVVADAPYAIPLEFGHHGYVPDGDGGMRYIGPVEGLHVLEGLL